MELNKYIDHTLVKRGIVKKEMDLIVKEAIKYKFKSVCTHPMWIDYIKERLHKAGVLVCVVIGFPWGQQTIENKINEAKQAIALGADELDFVINISKVKDGDKKYIEEELTQIRKATKGTTIKIIFETALLTTAEKKWAFELATKANWDFLKTSTAIGCDGATIEDVKLMAATIKKAKKEGKVFIKASGGVRNIEQANAMIKAGATRIGTSNGVLIIQGETATTGY